jgi:hypothetical protein
MKNIFKLVAVTGLISGTLLAGSPLASAYYNRDFRYDRDFWFDRKVIHRDYRYHDFDRRYVIRKPIHHFPIRFHDGRIPRDIVFVDRGFPSNQIIVRNVHSGPFSVNTARVIVDNGFFYGLRNNLSLDNDIDILVDTGRNIASFNTGSGIIRTGNVDVRVF